MMKKTGYIVLMMLMVSVSTFAQPRQKFERIHAIKVAYITDKIHLSSEQAAEFWPVYNRFEEELFDMRLQRKIDRNREEPAIKDDLELQQAVLDLRKKYQKEFLKTISEQQLKELYSAEREFKKMLLEQLRDRKNGGAPPGRFRR